ncbi:hypothetical protein [Pseudochrobactrum sp. B5]|uniref:hypothetical protein n=1 Tax=Pseudochrobactrum sp. B5 TaxID=1289478 RepID=UPI000AE65B16|nr:hypothetical protein [Pseudochrobactrum sp. B5]
MFNKSLVFISRCFVWSVLSNIGKSKIIKLTIFVPIIGMYLLFNDRVIDFLKFDSTFMKNLGLNVDSDVNGFTFSNIYFVYFGLCFVGVGSFLFNIFCPDEIKSTSYIMDYVSKVEFSENTVVAKSNLQFILDRYFENYYNDEDDRIKEKPEYPYLIEVDFYNLIHEMFNETGHDWDISENSDDASSLGSSIYLATGYPNLREIARMVWSSPKVIWVFTVPFKDLAPKFAKDISYVMFKNLNHSYFIIRMVISFFYIIGFSLLLKPTLETFCRLLWYKVL